MDRRTYARWVNTSDPFADGAGRGARSKIQAASAAALELSRRLEVDDA